jgi:hypothetical protein
VNIEPPARIAFLRKIHIFSGLGDADLAALAEELEEVNIPKEGVVFKQDTPADGFYMIYGGSVRIVRKQDGKEYQLALLVKNDYFGELALVSNRRRSATVTALQDTSLLFLSRADFQKLFKNHPEIQYNLEVAVKSRQLARRLRFKWLRPDEVVYFLARKHPIMLYQNLVLPVLALLVPLSLLYAWLSIAPSFIVAFAGGASLLAIAAWIVWLAIDWGNDYYIVTNLRVVWLEKIVGVYDSRQESPLSMVVSVGVEANQIGRILDYGNVIIRTFVGRIVFAFVNHPNQAAKMVEEYWQRTKEAAVSTEKEAMKDSIRRRLGLPIPPRPAPESDQSDQPTTSVPKPARASLLKLLGASTLKLRYETGDSVIYRKHWVVLILDAWIPFLGTISILVLFLFRLAQLAFLPGEAFISLATGLTVDAWAGALSIALVPFALWLAYRVMDWSNDKFEVTSEQIVDIDRKPFGTESRNAAALENILGTVYERRGLLGNIFNFGTVYITVGGNKLAFEDVIDPATVQSDIDRRRMARQQKKNEAAVAAERERMAEWLVTYHNNAEEFRKASEEEKRKGQNGLA